VPRAWQPCGSSPPPLTRAADRVPCLLSRSCSSNRAPELPCPSLALPLPASPNLSTPTRERRAPPWPRPPWMAGRARCHRSSLLHPHSQPSSSFFASHACSFDPTLPGTTRRHGFLVHRRCRPARATAYRGQSTAVGLVQSQAPPLVQPCTTMLARPALDADVHLHRPETDRLPSSAMLCCDPVKKEERRTNM